MSIKMIFERATVVEVKEGEYQGHPYRNLMLSCEGSMFKFRCANVSLDQLPLSEPVALEVELTGKFGDQKQTMDIVSYRCKPIYGNRAPA